MSREVEKYDFKAFGQAIKIWSSNKKCYCSKFLYSFVSML